MCVGLQDAESLEGVLVERPFSAAADPLHTATVPRCVRVNRTVSRVQEVQVVTHQSAPVGHNEEADPRARSTPATCPKPFSTNERIMSLPFSAASDVRTTPV